MPRSKPPLIILPLLFALVLSACASAGQAGATPTGEPAHAATAISTATPASGLASIKRPPKPVLGKFAPATVSGIKLEDYPVIPQVDPGLRALYQAGLAQGNDSRVFSKLGDCMTENPDLLGLLGDGKYQLGEYKSLQTTIDAFYGHPARSSGDWKQDSFATPSLAAASGFNIAGPLDSTWANPKWCQAGESPLACEYRVAKPSIAVIMFGTNDVNYTDAPTFDYYLRMLVDETLDRNIVPILNTFPTRPENPQKSLLLNQIVVRVALDYNIPLLNLNRALEALPGHGVDPKETTHLTTPPDKRVDVFTPQNLQTGFTLRNLVTLQALDAVLRAVGRSQK